MSEIENNSRIPDLDKDWTAANAENAYRDDTDQFEGKNLDPTKKAYWDKVAGEVGEERIADYDPKIESEVDELRSKAQEIILKCKFHLEREYGDIETARQIIATAPKDPNAHKALINEAYRALLGSMDLMTETIKSLDMYGSDESDAFVAGFAKSKKIIPDIEQKVLMFLQWIRESKDKL